MTRFWLAWTCLLCLQLRAAEIGPKGLAPIPPNEPFTFAVLGDNRGDDTGQQPAAFLELLRALREQAPAPAFALDTGDMIYGYTWDQRQAREQWRLYIDATKSIPFPSFHVPGNHDIWDKPSGRLYRELWGQTYFAFDYGNARFIGLDTESGLGRLGEEQFRWLEQQLKTAAQRNVFLFFHRPVFPVDGARGSSLDEYPVERERIHQLFVRYRDRVRAVFAGHEHLYNRQEHEGITYVISGGGGAPLYTAPELGGFHHYLLVHVAGHNVEIELKRVSAPLRKLEDPVRVVPGQVLEEWRQGLMWYAWDRTANVELTPERASQGRRGLRLNFDLNQYAWPVLVLPMFVPLDLKRYQSLSLEVYVPEELDGDLLITPAIEADAKFLAPSVRLKPGWNTVTTDLDAKWLPFAPGVKAKSLEWSLSASRTTTPAGYIVFDRLRAKPSNPANGPEVILENFERPLLWRVFDESVAAQIVNTDDQDQPHGLRLMLDFFKCPRPTLFARLNPPWDLTKVKALLLQTVSGDSLPRDLAVELCCRAKDIEYVAPLQPLPRGPAQLRFELGGGWLPATARASVELIAFKLVSTHRVGTGEVRFEKFWASGDS